MSFRLRKGLQGVFLLSCFCFIISLAFTFYGPRANAARLLVGPTTGSFTVGSTFDVSIYVNTEGETINAFEATLSFPPDMLQIVSPSTGKSVVGVWIGPPQFNNRDGIISLKGGITEGLNVSNGLVSSVKFRVKKVGRAVLKFSDSSKVLLHDGKGTDVLTETQNGVYTLSLPPPEGPVVVSSTHPDQSKWYAPQSSILEWASDSANGYSYVLNKEPVAQPDNISEGLVNDVYYQNISNGTHYFHIKSLRSGVWGGVTHVAINIDNLPPADFEIRISPSSRTTSANPVISFQTTDAHSGMSHYEYKVIDLHPSTVISPEQAQQDDGFTAYFIETQGKEILSLENGSYDIIVRAYDNAGNVREVTQRIDVVSSIFTLVASDGIHIGNLVSISWTWVFLIIGLTLILLVIIFVRKRKWHFEISKKHEKTILPENVKRKLEELEVLRKKYSKLALLLFALSMPFISPIAYAQNINLSPPFISTISENISNEEIFYIGGRTDRFSTEVIIYLQNLKDGETISQLVVSEDYEWFYRHDAFLPTGLYIIWTQTRLNEELSPPSPQISLSVSDTAIQFGSSRFSYEFVYLILLILFVLITIYLLIHIFYHHRHAKRKHAQLIEKTLETDHSIKRGFAVLRRDIQVELELIKGKKSGKSLSSSDMKLEEQLMNDLSSVEKHVSKEAWEAGGFGEV